MVMSLVMWLLWVGDIIYHLIFQPSENFATIIFQHEESDAVHGDLIDDKCLSQGYCCGWSYYLSLIA